MSASNTVLKGICRDYESMAYKEKEKKWTNLFSGFMGRPGSLNSIPLCRPLFLITSLMRFLSLVSWPRCALMYKDRQFQFD